MITFLSPKGLTLGAACVWLRVTIPALYILKTGDAQTRTPTDGVLGSTLWEVTVRASFDVCLRRDVGGGESYTREGRDEGGAAAKEIQGTRGVEGRGQPQGREGAGAAAATWHSTPR